MIKDKVIPELLVNKIILPQTKILLKLMLDIRYLRKKTGPFLFVSFFVF
jgi:hypothetical protein